MVVVMEEVSVRCFVGFGSQLDLRSHARWGAGVAIVPCYSSFLLSRLPIFFAYLHLGFYLRLGFMVFIRQLLTPMCARH